MCTTIDDDHRDLYQCDAVINKKLIISDTKIKMYIKAVCDYKRWVKRVYPLKIYSIYPYVCPTRSWRHFI